HHHPPWSPSTLPSRRTADVSSFMHLHIGVLGSSCQRDDLVGITQRMWDGLCTSKHPREGSKRVVRKNVLKQKLRAGEPVIGVFMPVPSPQLVEVSAVAGFDFVLIDNEHGPTGPET